MSTRRNPFSLLTQYTRLTRPPSTILKSTTRTRSYHATRPTQFHPSISRPSAFQIPKPSTRSPQPAYEMTFTCTPCSTRSTHRVSKQGYHKGSVLITCPECKNRHVIADNLKIFGDKVTNIEDILREKGQLVRRGSLNETSDLEFWEDGDVTERKG